MTGTLKTIAGSRRCFRSHLALGLVAGALVMAGRSEAAMDPTRDKILYQVANAHLDTQWNWTIQDTINSHIPSTLTNNFALFAKYPNYVFNFEGAFRYKLAREYYPAWYTTLTNYVAQGRWRVAGSVVDAGDVNVPSPEALMRHILYGNGFWKQEFGKTSIDIFLPDCFGFGYALPSAAAHCGVKGFSSQKLSWGSAVPIPFQNIGRWAGPDGASLIAVLQPGDYGSTIGVNLANELGALNRITNMGAATGLFIDYRYYGTGDIGGAPTDASVNWLEQSVTTTGGLIHVVSAGSDQLFRDLAATNVSRLPSYQGELLMKTHGTGCYSAHPEMKKYNRLNELRADAAERAAVIADWLQGGGTYPQQKLTQAWERFLWHQFHDDLTGTSVPAAYTFSWNDELLSLNEFGSELVRGVGILASALDTTVAGVPLVVFNPLSQARQDIVEARVSFTNGAPAAVRVFDPDGNEVASQSGTPVGNTVPVTFLATVPAAGAAVFDVRPSATPSSLNTGLSVSASQLENARYRVQLDANGDVASIFDKVNSRELLQGPIRWVFLPDSSAAWPAWEIQYADITAAPVSYLGGAPNVRLSESGPARASLEVTRHNAGSIFTERIRLAAGSAGDRVEWDVSINWGSPRTLLKVAFPLAVTNSHATFDLGLGTIQRGNATASAYEVPAQQWADLTASSGAYGVTLMNDCRYGWDKPNNNTLRLTVMHTPGVGSSYVYQAADGFGSHRLQFAVAGHAGDWRSADSPWTAARLNQPLQAFQTVPHTGLLGKTFGFLACDNPKVMIKAVKKAEASNEIIVRLQELSGQPQTAQMNFPSAITAARQVSGTEEPLGALTPAGSALTVSLGAYQPMTLALTLGLPGAVVAKPVSVPVLLPFNLDAISTDGNRTDGNFDSGYTYPAELLPPALIRGGITFQLGPTNNGALNAVDCRGQTIALPAGYDRLYLLVVAASNDLAATFTINGQVANLSVPYFSGFIGQWNPPFLKQAEVAWVCTHRHTGTGANDAYRFCYLFKCRLDLPAGASSLTLPNSPNLRLFAMSAARNEAPDTSVAGGALAQNELPWADAGADRLVNAGTNGLGSITLDGSGSVDPDGTIDSYTWTLNGSVLAAGSRPAVSLPQGTNTVVLTVADNQGAMGQDVVNIVVLTPLNVVASASPTNSSTPPLTVQFNGLATGGPTSPSDTTDDQGGTVSAQGQNANGGEVAANAFDNSTGSKWLDFANANPSTRASWIQYQYAAGGRQVVTSYTITSANDAPERDPADWRLLGSNDGGASWTTLDTRTGQTFSARFQQRAFTSTNAAPFNLYRLQIDRVANPATANSVQLSELEFIGIPPYLYFWSFGDGTTSTLQNPQHVYTDYGSYLAVLGVSCGLQTGTNTVLISVGTPLGLTMTAAPAVGPVPLTVWFTAQGSGGNGNRVPYDTTDDRAGTITAQGDNPPGEIAWKAFDNTSGTKWLDFAAANPSTRASWIQYQYAGGLQCVVSKYTVASANDFPDRDPADWRLLGSSNGGTAWTVVDIQTNQVFPSRFQILTYAVTNTKAYNLYRLQIDRVANPATANSVQLSELQFIGKPAYLYSWSFGDGGTSTAQNPQHTYASNGTYTVTLTVSDGSATVTKTQTVIGLSSVLSGALQVAIAPAEATSAGARWQVDGGSYQTSGTTLSNLAAGTHIVSFTSLAGFTAPAPLTLVVESGKTTLTTAVYAVQPPLVNWRWAPTNQVIRKYPKLANYHHGGPISADTAIDHYSERLAQWDVVIIPSDGTVSQGLSLHRMRESNPRVKLLTYLPYGQEPGGSITAGIPQEGTNDWYCRLTDGGYSIPFWGGHFMNPCARDFAWPKYAAEYTGNFYLSSGLYDGVFLDCLSDGEIGWVKADLNGDGLLDATDDNLWGQGQDYGLSLFRSRYPAAMVGGNSGNPWSAGCPYFAHVNVILQENALGNEFSTPTFDYVWQGYQTSLSRMQGPVKYYLIAADLRRDRTQTAAQELQSLTAEDLRRMRFGLGITLLDEGYFGFDRGDCLHGQLWWFDEYDADLGDALGAHQTGVYGPGLYHRYFKNGLVLVNPTGTSQTVDLGGPAQDVTTKVTSRWLAIPPSDARILLGAVPRLDLPRWVYLGTPASRVVYHQAQTITLEAKAYAAAGIARVEFYDGATLVETKTAAPFTCNWSFTKADNGVHVWTAKVVDSQGDGALSTQVDLTVDLLTEPQNPRGALRRQVYRGIAGYTVAELTASAKFPGAPDMDDLIGWFESADLGVDDYGEKLSGYLIPPLTGSYVFYLASDDSSQLFLSTDENPAHKRLIVQQTWTVARNWLGQTAWWDSTLYLPAQASVPINLEAGKWYYIEALHKEATGGDYVAVAWKVPGGAAPANGSEPIRGSCLAYRLPPQPAVLRDPHLTAGLLKMNLVGEPNLQYKIERSIDLAHWETVLQVNAANSVFPVQIPVIPGAQREFYRARLP